MIRMFLFDSNRNLVKYFEIADRIIMRQRYVCDTITMRLLDDKISFLRK